LIDDARFTIHRGRNLVEDVLGRVLRGLFHRLLQPFQVFRIVGGIVKHLVERDPSIPGFQNGLLRELGLGGSIGGEQRLQHLAGSVVAEAEPAGREDEAHGQAFDVPLERPRMRLVEIIDIEDERTFRRSKASEVHQMAVAAALNGHAGGRRTFQIVRLQDRRATKKSEGGFGHARKANRQQFLHASFVRLLDQGHRIALRLAEDNVGMARARANFSQGFPPQFAAGTLP